MASTQSTVDYIVDQVGAAGSVTAKKMFGEYGIFCEGKMVAIVGDDRLFVKPTAGGRQYVGAIEEAAPYPGAKPCFLIDPELWDDAAWLAGLIKITAHELPLPKEKKKKTN